MACHFNKFFASIASKTVKNINPSNSMPDGLIEQNLNTFSFSNKILTKTEILEATKLLADQKNTRSYWSFHKLCKKNYRILYQSSILHLKSFIANRHCASPVQNCKSGPNSQNRRQNHNG